MGNKKKRAEETAKIDPNAWMVTFSDLVILLLTFFVLLITMSSMDNKKLKEVFTQFRGSLGIMETSAVEGVHDLASLIQRYQDSQGLLVVDPGLLKEFLMPSEEKEGQLEAQLKDIQEALSILDDHRGIVVSIQEDLIFDSGESKIKKDVLPMLKTISSAMEAGANDILIMGHTDDVPIKSNRYDSNWELSAYRGLSVLDYFVNDRGISPSRVMVGGYGPSRPVHPNDGPENRARNRRVEIIFKHIGEG